MTRMGNTFQQEWPTLRQAQTTTTASRPVPCRQWKFRTPPGRLAERRSRSCRPRRAPLAPCRCWRNASCRLRCKRAPPIRDSPNPFRCKASTGEPHPGKARLRQHHRYRGRCHRACTTVLRWQEAALSQACHSPFSPKQSAKGAVPHRGHVPHLARGRQRATARRVAILSNPPMHFVASVGLRSATTPLPCPCRRPCSRRRSWVLSP